MKKVKDRKTNIIFKNLIHQLYGQDDYYKVKNWMTLKDTKKYYKKMLTTLKISINETIKVIDSNQNKSLYEIIDDGIERLESAADFEFIDNILLETQTKLIFQLIGLEPNRWSQQKVTNRGSNWVLNSHRQIQYVQSDKQKENLIFNQIQSQYSKLFPDFMKFYNDIYLGECSGKTEEFIKWFKRNHSEIYNAII